MTITLELTPEMEKQISERAQAAGLPPTEFLQSLIANALATPPEFSLYETASPEEWGRIVDEFSEDFASSIPVLSDEAISRESIYGERG